MVHSFFAFTRNICPILLAALLATVSPASTQAGERVMVVFDASGSMWGQIEGKSKIAIARDVLKRTLTDWKGLDMEAGLIVYGHRRKGDCGDIQTLIPTGPIDTAAFSRAVDDISPKGKTPLTEAVRRAAEELKYTEEKATVILMSDGKETCDVDPCVVAKELEKNGVDFTAHVIGFDVAKEAERKQLQCLAENTGGVFVSAKNANELSVAFERVTEPSPLTLTAVNKADGRDVPGPVNWSLKGGEVQIDKTTKTARLELPDVPDGAYSLKVAAGPFKGQGTFKLADQRPPALTIELVADKPKPKPKPKPPPQPTGPLFLDEFDGDSLKSDWEVLNEDPDSYIVEDGKLLIVGSGDAHLQKGNVPNIIRLKSALPKGDWVATIKFSVPYQTGRESPFLAIYEDKDNQIVATTNSKSYYGGLRGAQLFITGWKRTRGKQTSFSKVIWGGSGGKAFSAEQAPNPILLRITKKGRTYTPAFKLVGMKQTSWTEHEKLTALRPKGRLAIGIYQASRVKGETPLSIDWFKIEPLN